MTATVKDEASCKDSVTNTPESSTLKKVVRLPRKKPDCPIKRCRRPTFSKKVQYCCKCKETFPPEADLQVHFEKNHKHKIREEFTELLPNDPNKTQCSLCKAYVNNMLKHRRRKHYAVEKKKPFQKKLCKHCGKVYKYESGLFLCEKRHKNEIEQLTFQCTRCPKSFPMKESLKRHLKIHSEIFPYTCAVCAKKFRFLPKLKNHLIAHSTEKNYKCDVCQKEMKHSSSFKTHMMAHRNELNHQCEICSKRFVRNAGKISQIVLVPISNFKVCE
jgi:hypothetical protein